MLGTMVAEFDDTENGVHTEVWKVYSNGRYNFYVHTQDTDSGNWLPIIPRYNDEDSAIDRAKKICEGKA